MICNLPNILHPHATRDEQISVKIGPEFIQRRRVAEGRGTISGSPSIVLLSSLEQLRWEVLLRLVETGTHGRSHLAFFIALRSRRLCHYSALLFGKSQTPLKA